MEKRLVVFFSLSLRICQVKSARVETGDDGGDRKAPEVTMRETLKMQIAM